MSNRLEEKDLKSGKIALLLLFAGCMISALLAFFLHPNVEGEVAGLERKISMLFGAGFAFLGLSTFLLGHFLLRVCAERLEEKEKEEEVHDQGF